MVISKTVLWKTIKNGLMLMKDVYKFFYMKTIKANLVFTTWTLAMLERISVNLMILFYKRNKPRTYSN